MVSYDISLPAHAGNLNSYDDVRGSGGTFNEQLVAMRTIVIGENNPDNYIAEDYLYIMGNPSGISLVPGFYKVLSSRFEPGWDQWSFIGAAVGAPYGSDHATCDALALSLLGIDCPTVFDMYWPVLGIPGLALGEPCDIFQTLAGNGAVVYNSPSPNLSTYNGSIDLSISNLPAPSEPQFGTDYTLNVGGALKGDVYLITDGQDLDGVNDFELTHTSISNNAFAIPIPTYQPNQAFRLSFNTSWEDREITINSLNSFLDFKAMSRTITMPAGSVFWTGESADEPVAVIQGTRFGLTNLNHGYAIAPRRSRG